MCISLLHIFGSGQLSAGHLAGLVMFTESHGYSSSGSAGAAVPARPVTLVSPLAFL